MWWSIVIPSFLLGAMSSLHCVGMCGPLALSLPVHRISGAGGKVTGILLYNAGRITSYTLLGAIAGIAGRFIFVPAWQHWLAIFSGAAIILGVTVHYLGRQQKRIRIVAGYSIIYRLIARCLQNTTPVSFYLLGIANGLLPCGLVFIALTAAFVTNSFGDGILFMTMYGLGTVPLMVALSLLGLTVGLPLRNVFKRITPLLAVMAGVLLLLRGFNVTIPIISYWLPEHISGAGCRPLN